MSDFDLVLRGNIVLTDRVSKTAMSPSLGEKLQLSVQARRLRPASLRIFAANGSFLA